MCDTEFMGITFEELDQLGPLLCQSCYENIRKELKRVEESAPPLKGSGVYNHQYVPANEPEYRAQNRILKDRLQWQRTCYSLCGMQNDFLRKENRRLSQENEALKQENEQLLKAKKRLQQQLHKVLGVHKKGSLLQEDEQAEELAQEGRLDNDDKKQKRKRGAPVGHAGRTRPIPDKINEIEIIPPPCSCDRCGGTQIIEETDFMIKYTEDIPPVIKWVVEKRYMWGRCVDCHELVIEAEARQGPPVSIGVNLIALLTTMRQQMGVTYRKLSRFSTETLGIALSPSGVMAILTRVCNKLEPIYKGIESALPLQEVLYGDETGWKMNGERWYLWCFCNRSMVYFFPDKSRGSRVPKAILGEDYAGILVADFYAAYNFVEKTQRCLFHLQGDIKDELEISPEDRALTQLEEGIKRIIEQGEEIKQLPESLGKESRRKEIEQDLQKLTQLESTNKKTKALIKRITKHQNSLLRFIDHPDVEYHNNRSERTLRSSVIFRKISFGNRTPLGAYRHAVLGSTVETARSKNINSTDFIKLVYMTSFEEIKKIIRALLFDTS